MKPYEVERIFTYHRPHGNQGERYDALRAAGLQLAKVINTLAPESGEKTLAIRRVQEAIHYANAAIAINEAQPPACALCGGPILPTEMSERISDGQRAHTVCADRRGR